LVWTFESTADGVHLHASFHTEPRSVVGLRYGNPDGRDKICLNTKLARCEIRVRRAGEAERVLRSAHRAAFEILGDDAEGMTMAV
jgi:hypothetical protein